MSMKPENAASESNVKMPTVVILSAAFQMSTVASLRSGSSKATTMKPQPVIPIKHDIHVML